MGKVIIAGSIITDMSVIVNKHPSVGETIIGGDIKYSPGGKGANQAVSAARLGADVHMLGKIGKDNNGKMCLDFMLSNNIGLYGVLKHDKLSSGVAMIIVSEKDGNNNIVVSLGANNDFHKEDINITISEQDILVAQFETPLETTKYFFQKGKELATLNILNPAPARDIPLDMVSLIDILIVNETELEAISDTKVNNDIISVKNAINNYRNRYYFKGIIIATLGENGVYASVDDIEYLINAEPTKVVDTTGAGDCFVGAIAAYFSQNELTPETLKDALLFANRAASLSVSKSGSGISMPYLSEVI